MSATAIANEVTELTTFPDIAFRISDLLNDENSSAWDIGALIEQDPGLAAALLRIANSALYNSGVPITAVDRAVAVVGAQEVRDLAFGLCARSTLDGIPNELVQKKDFWMHSLYSAAAAKTIAKTLKIRTRESLFMAGLLHDVGQLVLFSQRPEQSREALLLAIETTDGTQTSKAEQDIFGFDHTAVGAALMTAWSLPDYLAAVALYHHDPSAKDTPSAIVDVVHIANSLAVLAELSSENLDDAPPIDEDAMTRIGMTTDAIPEVMTGTHEAVAELQSVFLN